MSKNGETSLLTYANWELFALAPDMARALLAAEELADACEEVFDGIDAVGTRRFYIALAAFRKAMEQE